MSRQPVEDDELLDCKLGTFSAVRMGDYSNTSTDIIIWCAKLNSQLVHICLQGHSMLSQEVQDDVERILATLSAEPLSA